MDPLDIQGDVPKFEGQELEALVCEEYWHAGSPDDPVNVIHFFAGGAWHRLYFDYGIIHWSEADGPPTAYAMPELDAEVKLVDLALRLDLRGEVIQELRAAPIEHGSAVRVWFRSGRGIVFRNVHDVTGYTESRTGASGARDERDREDDPSRER